MVRMKLIQTTKHITPDEYFVVDGISDHCFHTEDSRSTFRGKFLSLFDIFLYPLLKLTKYVHLLFSRLFDRNLYRPPTLIFRAKISFLVFSGRAMGTGIQCNNITVLSVISYAELGIGVM